MNSSEILTHFRREVSDLKKPYLWSNEETYRWIDDAQTMFCRLTEGIEDASTTAICRINVVPGTEWYTLSPKILKLRSVARMDTGSSVPVVNMEKAPSYGIRFDGRPGPLKVLVTGFEKHKLRAGPMPNETVTLELAVFRLPLEPITDAGDEELEIDEQHHLSLVEWVKHKAYLKDDAETYDRRRSDEAAARFYAACASAKTEQVRARRSVSTVLYGGI